MHPSGWALAPIVALALVPAAAQAAIVPKRTDAEALELAKAIAQDPSAITSSTFSAIAPKVNADDDPAALSDVPLGTFPRNGSTYAILSNGDAKLADHPNSAASPGVNLGTSDAARGPSADDILTWNIGLDVPADRNCLVVRFRFLSEESAAFVDSGFNDGFVAELDKSTWKTTPDPDAPPNAPDNFAFDEKGRPITINATGVTAATAENAAGTTYDGATRRLAAATVVTPGAHTLFLSIYDQGDHVYDSAAFVDDLQLLNADPGRCTSGAFLDDAPPNVSVGAPSSAPEALVADGQSTNDDTPTFGGKAGTTLNDDKEITGTIFTAASLRATPLNGTALQTKKATVAPDGSWAITADTLPEGSYAFQAGEGSSNGQSTVTDPIRFTIDTTAPAPALSGVGLGDRTRDTTPALAGTASTGAGDSATLSIKLFAGKAATGTPVQTLAATAANGAWTTQVATFLKDGAYTAVVEQGDVAGNTATATRAFTVTTSNPIKKVRLPRRLTRAKAAQGLKGSVAFDFPGKATFTLTATVGTRTLKLANTNVVLTQAGKATFRLRPGKAMAAVLRRAEGTLVLKTGFTDDQGTRYSRTQKVPFR